MAVPFPLIGFFLFCDTSVLKRSRNFTPRPPPPKHQAEQMVRLCVVPVWAVWSRPQAREDAEVRVRGGRTARTQEGAWRAVQGHLHPWMQGERPYMGFSVGLLHAQVLSQVESLQCTWPLCYTHHMCLFSFILSTAFRRKTAVANILQVKNQS